MSSKTYEVSFKGSFDISDSLNRSNDDSVLNGSVFHALVPLINLVNKCRQIIWNSTRGWNSDLIHPALTFNTQAR